MRAFAEQPLLAAWYAHLDIELALSEFRSQMDAKRLKAIEKLLAKAHTSGQHEGAGQADHRGRRAAADHQRPPADRPG